MSERIVVYVDSNEYAVAREVAEVLRKNFGCVIVVKDLDVADYVASERVAVERKTVIDLVNSIKDGRLFDQVKRLKQLTRDQYS